MRQFKPITLENRNFKVTKFLPEAGCFWAFKLFGSIASINIKNIDLVAKIRDFMNMDRKEFKQFQSDCLQCVYVDMESGSHCLVDEDGNLIIPNLTAPTVFALTLHSFMYSIVDFFDSALLESLGTGLGDIFQELGNTKSSSSQSPSDIGNTMTSGTENTQ